MGIKTVSSRCTVKIGENKFAVEGNTIKSITVYDIFGRMYYQKAYLSANFIEIPKNLLPSGISLIQVQTDTKQVVLKNLR